MKMVMAVEYSPVFSPSEQTFDMIWHHTLLSPQFRSYRLLCLAWLLGVRYIERTTPCDFARKPCV